MSTRCTQVSIEHLRFSTMWWNFYQTPVIHPETPISFKLTSTHASIPAVRPAMYGCGHIYQYFFMPNKSPFDQSMAGLFSNKYIPPSKLAQTFTHPDRWWLDCLNANFHGTSDVLTTSHMHAVSSLNPSIIHPEYSRCSLLFTLSTHTEIKVKQKPTQMPRPPPYIPIVEP